MMEYKRPVSVLVVIHTPDHQILLLERAQHRGYWQSVTGSQEGTESLCETAAREVFEETGIQASHGEILDWHQTYEFEIFAEWRARFAPCSVPNTTALPNRPRCSATQLIIRLAASVRSRNWSESCGAQMTSVM